MSPGAVRRYFATIGRALADILLRPACRRLCARAGQVLAAAALVLIQGHTALQAADLPQVLTGVSARFDGAHLPVVTGNHMVVDQFADKATLHWQSFNVGADGHVEFRQPGASSVALNRIFDAAPSQVNGKLTANGQVYLINQNGIVFGGNAQVNTQSLVASTLDIDDRVYQEVGFVNAINDSSGALPAFESFGHPMGEIRLAEGARLESARGGRILVFAPTIVNEGAISTPEGQQVLAAVRDKVLIAASDDPDLRGLLVEVSTGGEVTNLGTLLAERGNITLLGMAVNQEGVARATTSVSLNGSIRLLARDMKGTPALQNDLVPRKPKPVQGGTVTLGGGSVTEVVPDTTAGGDGTPELAVDAQSQPLSRVDIAGERLRLASGARVTATGGVIDLTAAANPGQPDLTVGDPATRGAELVIESGAILDASGDDTTTVSVARNVVEVEARGNELADSPVQRDGPIRNETLRVDIRRGTDFLDIDGAVAAIGRSAAERQSAGGSVRVRSEGRFVLEQGARIDVSGGQVTYTEGQVATSRLLQANGKVVGIAGADPDQRYLGVVDDAVSFEAGYVEGKDAGSLTLQARGVELAGELLGGAIAGVHQRQRPVALDAATPVFARAWDQQPLGGALALTQLRAGLPGLVLGATPAAPGTAVPPLVLSAGMLRASGLTRLGFVNAGAIVVDAALQLPAWSELGLTGTEVDIRGELRLPGGTVVLNASNELVGSGAVPDESQRVRIDGVIDVSGTWVNDNPLLDRGRPTAPIVLDGGSVVVDSGGAIEVRATSRLDASAGAWRSAGGDFEGGSGGRLAFATGTVATNPAFGLPLQLAGELSALGFSSGGSLEIETERIRIVPQAGAGGDTDLRLDGSRQFALHPVTGEGGNTQYVLEIGAGTFQQGGFGAYRLTSTRSDLAVASGADLRLRTANYRLAGTATALRVTGTPVGWVAETAFLPDFQREAARLELSVNERLANAVGPVADLTIGAGARIVADPGSHVSLRSTTSLFVDGAIDAPAGHIELRVGGGPGIFQPEQMIWLGTSAQLTAGGVVLVDTLDPPGLRRGEVLDAGRITVRAEQGSIIGAAGARLAVDGTAGLIDAGFGLPVRQWVAGGAGTIEFTAAESLIYQGALGGAAPAGFATPGGQLTIGIDPSQRGVPSLIGTDGIPRGPHMLVMGDFTGSLPGVGEAVDPQYASTGFVPLAALRAGGFAGLDVVVRSSATGTDDAGAPVPDTSAALPVIRFRDDLDLHLARSLRLDAAVLETGGAQVSLAAPLVSIGYGDTRVPLEGAVPDKTGTSNPQDTTVPIRLTPVAGEGRLQVAAELIELVGETVTHGFGDATAGRDGVVLQASGDLRLRGVRKTLQSDYSGLFRTAGNLAVEAQRIYPTTLTSFEIGVEDAGGRITLGGGGNTATPLSVGGSLTVRAAQIVQDGALFAPLGEIDLDATSALLFTAGSLTSTAATGLRAPFFRTEPGGALIVPAPGAGEDQLVFVDAVANPEFERMLPEKRIRLAAPDIELQAGSQFDLRGGSEVAATEFVPGPGGSRDILLADLDRGSGVQPNESFAILPAVGAFAPYDPLETPAAESVQGIGSGDTLVLAEGLPGLPAGEYAILPARYALFGGFLVTPESGFRDIGAGLGLQRADGAPILAGRLGVAGNDTAAGRSQGFAIEDGSSVRRRAEYLLTPLDEAYEAGTIRAPGDAGRLVVEAGERLDLRGELIRSTIAAGLGSAVDISTTAALSVVPELTGAGGIELRALDLANLGADSLLLGGTRAAIDGGLQLLATSSTVSVAAGVVLDQPELLLVGERIVVASEPGAATRLESTAAPGTGSTRLLIEEAAVLALSGRPLTLERGVGAAPGQSGITVGEGAAIEAGGGLILDAEGDVAVAGRIGVRDGILSLGSGRVSLGETSAVGGGGLVLSNADLAALAGNDLRLRSRSAIEVHGAIADPATGAPLAFGRLTLDAPGIDGLGNAGHGVVLAADSIELRNGGATSIDGHEGSAATGSSLRLQATQGIVLGDGVFGLRGYESSQLAAGSALLLSGNGGLDVDGALAIEVPVITATRDSDTVIRLGGALTVAAGGPGATVAAPDGLGASLSITAADIAFDGRIVLPSGTVELIQAGDLQAPVPGHGLRFGAGAVVDVAGVALAFGPKTVGTPGGAIHLAATTGGIDLGADLRLDASAAAGEGAEAGEIVLSAPHGALQLGPGAQLLARDPAGTGGRFTLDATTLVGVGQSADEALGSLAATLEAGGFREQRNLRLRDQDLVVAAGSTITAREIRLVADRGRVEVAGALDASGDAGGRIWLAAGDSIDVSGFLSARATAAGGDGGRIDLYALDADGDDAAGIARDGVHLRAGALLDVGAGSDGRGGVVLVHGRRLDTDEDGQTDQLVVGELAGEVRGASRAQLLATRVLRDPDAVEVSDPGSGTSVARVTVTADLIEAWRSESEAFLAGLATADAGPLQVGAALQVESSGDLVLQDRWNLREGWSFGEDLADPTAPRAGVAGVSTRRAARHLEIGADLTDAFAEQFLFGFLPVDGVLGALTRYDASGAAAGELVRPSWGYRLAAGADLGSADVLALGTTPGRLTFGAGVRVRTGTADIDVAAGGDIRLAEGAALYTAGWDRGLSASLQATLAPIVAPQGLTAYDLFGTWLNGGQFADGGGHVSITGHGSLVADAAPGVVTEWLTRIGSGQVTATTLYSATEGFGAVPTHWAVAYSQFRNGVAAFGGGDLRIAVAGDVANVALAVPTTGRTLEGVVLDTSVPGKVLFEPSARTTEILGGGALAVRAGGSLDGGQVVIGRGTAVVRTGGDIGASGGQQLFVGADAGVDWLAGGSLVLAGLQDPTVTAASATQIGLMAQIFSNIESVDDFDNRFYTYTDGSRVRLAALGGDVRLDGPGFGTFLPPSLSAVALGGDVEVVATPIDFFPAPTGTLELIARGNVTGNFAGSSEARIRQSDQDRSLLPGVDHPDVIAALVKPAPVPVHLGDTVPNLIVAHDGSIQSSPGKAGFWTLELAKPALFSAGTDISNLSVRVQHVAPGAVSTFQAGRDIVQGELRDNTGRFAANDRRIFEIWGPGSAEFLAVRDISLGTSAGIESIGNAKNAALGAEGSALRLLAGTGGEPAWERFIEVYLSTAPSAYRDEINAVLGGIDSARAGYPASSDRQDLTIRPGEYAVALGRFLDERGIALVDGDLLLTFRGLDRTLQREFITEVLFAEIGTWGTAAETPDRADRLNYVRGFTALDTLFAAEAPLADRAAVFPPGAVEAAVASYLAVTDPLAANAAQVELFGALFPSGARRGDISLLLSQVQTLAGGSLSMLAPGGDVNAGAADAEIIAKQPTDLGIVTARGGDIGIAVARDLLVNSTRVFALQGDLLVWSSHGNIDAGKGAKTVTSVPDPITRIDPNTGNTIIEFPPAVVGSGLQGENAALFAPRGAVNAGDAGIRTSGDLTIGAVEIVGTDNIDVGGVEIGFSTAEVAAVAPPGASSASAAATRGMESDAAMLGEEDELGERTILGTGVSFITVEVLSFGDGTCEPGEEGCD